MKEKKEGIMFALFVMVVIVVIAFFVFYSIATGMKSEYIPIDSEIIGIDTNLDGEGKIKYLNVTFANGESYDIEVYKDLDLTVNSKMIIELKQTYYRGMFWDEFKPYDDYWSISRIIKVPETSEDQ